jgi:lipopolysaccharide export system protein LptC
MAQSDLESGTHGDIGTRHAKRGEDQFVAAERHSRRVRFLKIAFPVVATAGVALLAAFTVLRPASTTGVSTDSVSLSDGRIVMANPKLDGLTGDKRPYAMRAERAFQEIGRDGLVELEKITAELPFGTNSTAQLRAGGGFFDNTRNVLDLGRTIELTTSDGMTAKLASARIDIGKNSLSTDKPVDISTAGSRITAGKLSVSEGGKLLVFETNVRLTIDPKKLNNASETPAPEKTQ